MIDILILLNQDKTFVEIETYFIDNYDEGGTQTVHYLFGLPHIIISIGYFNFATLHAEMLSN